MKNLSLQVPDAVASRLSKLAKKRKLSRSALVREALEAYFANGSGSREISCYDLAPDLAGCLDGGPGDLATNKVHMEGFGE